MNLYGLIVLAAGASTRLGKPKQLLEYSGTKLILHIVQTALKVEAGPVVVVLGANAHLIQPELKNLPVSIAENPKWEEGMASSIRTGVSALLYIAPNVDGAILMVCDQPFVSLSLLREMIAKHKETGKEIIACAYASTLGTPVLFANTFFPQLLRLQGSEGAKKVIKQQPASVETVSFPMGVIDIDTKEDYEALQQNKSDG